MDGSFTVEAAVANTWDAVWVVVMYWGLLLQQGGKNASQTKRWKLLVDLAVRRCAGMQPAAGGAMGPPRGEKGREKRGGFACQPFCRHWWGGVQGNDQSTTSERSRGSGSAGKRRRLVKDRMIR